MYPTYTTLTNRLSLFLFFGFFLNRYLTYPACTALTNRFLILLFSFYLPRQRLTNSTLHS